MKYAKIKWYDISNGPGVRASLFVSGCTHGCKGCFNQEAQNFNYGSDWTKEVENNLINHLKRDEIKGLNVLGGEPLQVKDRSLADFLSRVRKEVKKPIWLWTGYTWEQINDSSFNLTGSITARLADVLIDGLFEESLKDLSLKYRGSSNQRVINMQETFEKKEITLLEGF